MQHDVQREDDEHRVGNRQHERRDDRHPGHEPDLVEQLTPGERAAEHRGERLAGEHDEVAHGEGGLGPGDPRHRGDVRVGDVSRQREIMREMPTSIGEYAGCQSAASFAHSDRMLLIISVVKPVGLSPRGSPICVACCGHSSRFAATIATVNAGRLAGMSADVDPAVPPSGTGCVECDAAGGWWVHLRRCAACGHIGCCDDSLARHASAHWRETGHPIIRSFEPGEDWFWNYQTNEYYDGPELAAPHCRPRTRPFRVRAQGARRLGGPAAPS